VQGSYPGIKTTRNYLLTLYGHAAPVSITVNGQEISHKERDDKSAGWYYNGKELSVNIDINHIATDQQTIIKVDLGSNTASNINNGLREQLKRLSKATTELKYRNAAIVIPRLIGEMEETNQRLEYHPESFSSIIRQFNDNFHNIPKIIKELDLDKATETWYLSYLGLIN